MLALDMGKRFITSLLDITMGIAVNTAAFGSAMWMFTQLLPEEDLVPDVPGDYVYDSSAPLEQTGDASLYKARPWSGTKGVYKLVLSKTSCKREWTAQRLVAEAGMLSQAKGVPHVQQYEASALETPTPSGQSAVFFLLMERLQGGASLRRTFELDAIERLPASERIEMARQVTRNVLEALAELHGRGIAHGALSAESPYVVASKDETGRTWDATLTDVTSAARFQPGERVLRGDLLELEGKQLEYVAPEVLVRTQKGADTGFPVVAHKVDVWSAGIILLQVASKHLPFEGSDDGDSARELIQQHKSWESALHHKKSRHPLLILLDSAPPDFASLATRLLQPDPVRRPTATEALQHSFFKS